ncbi:MAG: hypothetical protein JO043_10695 [Candidatus Eremiobacteraeota bacterium]|nr:hypothetical protein [Candidatus Eremiobacteraeota bacterium]
MTNAEELLQLACQRDPAALEQFAKTVTPSRALGDELSQLGDRALESGDLKKGTSAYRLATSVFDAIGDGNEAARGRFMVLQVAFMAAQTEDQYRFVYDQSRPQIERSEALPYALRFNLIALAADAAFWASTVGSAEAKLGWIARSLDDLATLDPAQADDSSVARYASLLIADLQALRDLGLDQATLDQAEVRFSKAAASLAGRQIQYQADPEKGPAVVAALARIAAGQFLGKRSPLFGRKDASS